jgi:hypothetical protein
MNILDHELVKKYFGCSPELNYPHDCLEFRSKRVLDAMQQPIKKGERYLEVNRMGCEFRIREKECDGNIFGVHFYELRLPDAWQGKECEHTWVKNSGESCYKCNEHRCEAQPIDGKTWCQCRQHKPAPETFHPSLTCECSKGDRHHLKTSDCYRPSSAVEEKIQAMCANVTVPSKFESELRELVRLAREGQ